MIYRPLLFCKTHLRWLMLGLVVLGGFIAGVEAGLRLAGEKIIATPLGHVEVSARLGEGGYDLYVPLTDWGIRAHTHTAPLLVEIEVRSVDRNKTLQIVGAGDQARDQLQKMRPDAQAVIVDAAGRAIIMGSVGGITGSFLAASLLALAWGRRRLVIYGTAAGVGLGIAFAGLCAWDMSRASLQAFEKPVLYAKGGELPRLLRFAQQLDDASAAYQGRYERALASYANLLEAAQGQADDTSTIPGVDAGFMVASDFHNNELVLEPLSAYAQPELVLMPGDFVQLGTKQEADRVAQQIADLGSQVVAVAGNHDSEYLMRQLAEEGVIVLANEGALLPDGTIQQPAVRDIGGWQIAGFADPLQAPLGKEVDDHELDLTAADRQRAEHDLTQWFDQLEPHPDIVLIHQHGLGHALLDHLAQRKISGVSIVTGHDHEAHLEERAGNLLIDGGSIGAGGPWEIGERPSSFAIVEASKGGDITAIKAVNLISIEPLSGEGKAQRLIPQLTP